MSPAGGVLPPERLGAHHDLSAFSNGKHKSLDDWLRDRALASEGISARTYVACAAAQPNLVAGYYAITTAMEQRLSLPMAKLRKGMPDQVPLLLLGRLAVDQRYQGIGLGTDLLADAIRRCLRVSEIAGVRAVITHAIDDAAAAFYARRGFIPSPLGERLLLMPIEFARSNFLKA